MLADRRDGSAQRRRRVAWIARGAVALLALEAAAQGALPLLSRVAGIDYRPASALVGAEQRRQIGEMIALQSIWYQQIDPLLGWINAAGRSYLHYTQNRTGLRARREYAPEPPAGTLRVAAFGDSFVHGDEVGDDHVWSRLIEVARPDFEVLNFGVSGYGVDQAFLRYRRDGVPFRPHVVLIGFFADDLARNVSVFRPFLAPGTGHQMTKPRFELVDGQLVEIANPLRTLDDYRRLLDDPEAVLEPSAPHDEFFPLGYRSGPLDALASVRLAKIVVDQLTRRERVPYLDATGAFVPESAAYRLTLALLERFAATARDAGSAPIVAMLPGASDVERRRRDGTTSYAQLARDLRDHGVMVVDLAADLARSPDETRDLFLQVHYSERGNRIVADALARALDAVAPVALAANVRAETRETVR